MSVIRWGIIGCGDVCEVKSGPAFQNVNGSELVAVMRRDAAKAADFASRHGVSRWYCDADALIDDRDVDAVYIATPPGSHEDLAMRVASRGKPCYVEKPMARSAIECDRMNDAFAAAKIPLFVAYYRRCLPRFVRAKQLIDDGRLGAITSCQYRMTRRPATDSSWRVSAKQSGGGLFLDLASHTLDLMDYLLGPFIEYGGSAHGSKTLDVEDRVALHFRTERNIVGTGLWDFAGSANEETLEIMGTEGRLSLSIFGNDPVALDCGAAGVETFDEPNPPHVHQPLVQKMVDQLLGRGTCPSTGESAARTSRVMDAALTNYYGSRADDFWNRSGTWPGRSSNLLFPASAKP